MSSHSKRYDWVGKDFSLAKNIALYYIGILEQLVRGKRVSRVSLIRNFVRTEYGIALPDGVIHGLFYAGSGDITPGPIYRMGLEPRIEAWKRLPRNVSLNELKRVRRTIEDLKQLPDSQTSIRKGEPVPFLTDDLYIESKPDDEIVRTSDFLEIGAIYSRKELVRLFKIRDRSINTGVFQPKGHASVWLFVTEEKTPNRRQYHDRLHDDILEWDGQEKGGRDGWVINHRRDKREILLFYRKKRTHYPGYGFRYEGPFEYITHWDSGPSHFILQRVHSPSEKVNKDIEAFLDEHEIIEGKRKMSHTSRYERDPRTKRLTIQYHGTKCVVCGFDFGQTYGPYGEGFIVAHHLVPLGSSDEEMTVNPKTDMTVLCANCHRMVHRRRDYVLSLDQLRQMMDSAFQ